jgi:hypothetical protein
VVRELKLSYAAHPRFVSDTSIKDTLLAEGFEEVDRVVIVRSVDEDVKSFDVHVHKLSELK